jgi:hypothetical protein
MDEDNRERTASFEPMRGHLAALGRVLRQYAVNQP